MGFHRHGFDCTGVDIADVGYPYTFIHRDIREQQPPWKGEFDVIVASPPCNEFSHLRLANKKKPPDPAKGIELVKEAKRIIEGAQPEYWLIENVNGALKHLYPILGSPRLAKHPYYLWGNFPRFLWPQSNHIFKAERKGQWLDRDDRSIPLMQWVRSRIPIPISQAVGKACAEACYHTKTENNK